MLWILFEIHLLTTCFLIVTTWVISTVQILSVAPCTRSTLSSFCQTKTWKRYLPLISSGEGVETLPPQGDGIEVRTLGVWYTALNGEGHAVPGTPKPSKTESTTVLLVY